MPTFRFWSSHWLSPPPIGDYASTISDAWLEERQHDLQRLDKRVSKIVQLLEQAEISASVQSEYAEFVWAVEEIGRHARYSDLIFVGPEVRKSEVLKSLMFVCKLFSRDSFLSGLEDESTCVKLLNKAGDRAFRRRLAYSYARVGYRISVCSSGAASV